MYGHMNIKSYILLSTMMHGEKGTVRMCLICIAVLFREAIHHNSSVRQQLPPFFTSFRFTAYNYLFMPFSTTVAFKDDTALFNNLQAIILDIT